MGFRLLRRTRSGLLCALLLHLLTCSVPAGAEAAKKPEKRLLFVQQARKVPPRRDNQLLVSLANGNLVALDQETGETLWTFETGAPLVSSTPVSGSEGAAAPEGGGEEPEGAEGGPSPPKDSIFPGTDGSLYAYRQAQGDEPPRIEKLPVSVSELVNQSPAPTLDGSLMMGSQHTTVFLIDGASGELIRTFYDFDGELAQIRTMGAAALGLPADSQVDLANAVVIGRKDYVVRSVHPEFGEQWNVTWSKVQRLAELEVMRPGAGKLARGTSEVGAGATAEAGGGAGAAPAADEAQQQQQEAGGGAGGGTQVAKTAELAEQEAEGPSADGVGLVVGPDFSLRRFDPGSGWERWAHKFDAVPIAAYSSAGGRLDLLDPTQRQQHLEGAGAARAPAAGKGAGVEGKPRGLPLPKFLAQVWQGGVAGGAGASAGASSATPGLAAGGQRQGEGSAGEGAGPDGGMCASGGPDEVLVGLLGGSLFGVPASHLTFDVSQQQCHLVTDLDSAGMGAAPPPSLPDSTQGPSGLAGLDGSAGPAAGPSTGGLLPGTSLALQPRPLGGGDGGEGGEEMCKPDDPSAKCTVALGMYKLTKPGSMAAGRAGMLLLPASANESGERTPRRKESEMAPSGVPSSQSWEWAVVLLLGAAGGSVAVLLLLRARSAGQVPRATQGHARDVELTVMPEEQPLLPPGSKESQAQARRSGQGGPPEGSESSKPRGGGKKKNGAALKGKHLSNRMRGDLLQQMAAAGRGEGGDGGAASGSSSTGGGGPRHASQGPEAGGSGRASAQPSRGSTEQQEGEAGSGEAGDDLDRQNSLPSSLAVQQGLQDAAMRRREMRDGRVCVGRMKIGPGILGYGSGGTVVFEGEMDGRPVAVKRLLRQFYDLAHKEIGALILSDEHPNVVRVFGLEEDHEFCYLALERCTGTLAEAMQVPAMRQRFVDEQGRPTPLAYQVARDVGHGLEALHARDIVHRDLKPHNVLLTESGRAKLSDMGLSKRLVPEQSSFESVGSGGSSGWQAPEQLVSRSGGSARQTRSVDVFSYGLLLHYCLTGGAHPFGESYERDANILMGRMNLKHLQQLPLAADLIRGMIAAAPGTRPSMPSVMCHPLWWDVHRRLALLIDVSDRVEGEDRAEDQSLYQSLETLVEEAVGPSGSWAAAMDSGLVNNLGKYRRYSYSSLRDLLRVIRNKHNHFRELPAELQRRVGPLPEGFLDYFTTRYPGLLATCFYFALRWCADEPVFQKYFTPASPELLEKLAPRVLRQPLPAEQTQQAGRPPCAGAGTASAAASTATPAQASGLLAAKERRACSGSGEGGGGTREGEVGRDQQGQPAPIGVLAQAVSPPAVLPPPRPPSAGETKTQQPQQQEPCQQQQLQQAPREGVVGPAPAFASADSAAPAAPLRGSAAQQWPPARPGQAQAGSVPSAGALASPLYLAEGAGTTSGGGSPASPATLPFFPSSPSSPPDAASSPPADTPQQQQQAGSSNALRRIAVQRPGSAAASPAGAAAAGPAAQQQHSPPEARELSPPQPPAGAAAVAGQGTPSTPPILSRGTSLGFNLPASPLIGGTPKTLFRLPSDGAGPSEPRGPDPAPGFGPLLEEPPQFGPPPAGVAPSLVFWPQGVPPLGPSPFAPGGLLPPQQQQQPAAAPPQQQQAQQQPGGPRPRGPPKLDPQLPERDISPVGMVEGVDGRIALFPHRPGQPICDFFMKTGHCKFGEMCKFDHPPKFAVKLNHAGLPLRPGEPTCSFYDRFGDCKFGPSCKFHHPNFKPGGR